MSTQLRGPLRDLLDDPIEHEALERVRRKVRASRMLPAEHRWRWAPAAAVMLVLVLGGGAWWSVDRSAPAIAAPGPLLLASGAPLRTLGADQRARYSLNDGSWISLTGGTSLEALENGASRVVLAQGDGRATYEVRPGGPRRWSIDAGALVVDVIGTRFTIVRRGTHVRVNVARGRVRVRGTLAPGGIRTLNAGDSIEVGAPEPRAVLPEAPAPGESAQERAQTPRVEWRALADRGDYHDAFEALGADGLALATRRSSSVDELFALADTARLSGHPDLAVDPLRRIVDEHSTDERAGVAALTLGRMQLDALNAPVDACTSLDRAIALGVPSHLAEVAYARAIEAHRRAGDHDRMRELGREYLERFPEGRNADRVRGWIEGP